jgi:hypothetical protein
MTLADTGWPRIFLFFDMKLAVVSLELRMTVEQLVFATQSRVVVSRNTLRGIVTDLSTR